MKFLLTKTWRYFFSVIIFMLWLQSPNAQQFPTVDPNAKLTYKIIPVENNTWGYDIYNEGKLMVHQPRIPSVPGTEGFSKKTDAEKVAKKVISKIRKGELPPSVSVEELKELKVYPKQ